MLCDDLDGWNGGKVWGRLKRGDMFVCVSFSFCWWKAEDPKEKAEPKGGRHLGLWVTKGRKLLTGQKHPCCGMVCCSMARSCLTLCDTIDSSTPGFRVLHYLQAFVQTHVHWVDDATQPFILCCPLLLLPLIFPSMRVFLSELALHIRWPKDWSFSFSISPSNEYSGLISFRIDWIDLLAV